MQRLFSWNLGNVEYPFIVITVKSTLTWSNKIIYKACIYEEKIII